MLDLGPRGRVIFAAVWLAGQTALVLTAAGRPDGVFGFRMFPEASTLEVRLERQVGDGFVPAPGGEWSARDASGQLRHFSWRDRVRDPVLSVLDERRFASYGAEAQLVRLARAVDDVSRHIPEDGETRSLRAIVVVSKNGQAPRTVVVPGLARSLP